MTLHPDVEALVKRAMRERDSSFKDVVNDALRMALAPRGDGAGTFRTPTFRTGRPLVNLDKALQLAAALEDDAITRKTALGK